MTSALEETFYLLAISAGFPDPQREVVLIPNRRFRADFAWTDRMIAVEIEGGIWTEGRHTRGAGYTQDCEKYNLAQLEGWRVFRFTGDMVTGGEAIKTLRAAWESGL